MGYLTNIFILLLFVVALNCAPFDDSTVSPPAIALYTASTTTTVIPSSSTEHHSASKRQIAKDNSSESKESDESSEEVKNRPVRDTGTSGVIAHQEKQDSSSTPGVTPTPSYVTKETSQPQISARKRRGVYYDDIISPAAHAPVSQSTTDSGTTSSSTTTATAAVTTDKPN